jgi:hypothetical protein
MKTLIKNKYIKLLKPCEITLQGFFSYNGEKNARTGYELKN